jgi:phosphotransferase family enzyme
MDSDNNAGHNRYRLIVTRHNAAEFLLLPRGRGWSLPFVEIPPEQRTAQQLTAELYAASGWRGYCLLISPAKQELSRWAAIEIASHGNDSRVGGRWFPVDATTQLDIDSAIDRAVIEKCTEELAMRRRQSNHAPFARAGWLTELFRWVAEQIAPVGLRLTGGFTQLNASPAFTLIRLETDGSAVWFKAAGRPNRHELPVTVCLARLFPEYLPHLLGVHPRSNGWLAEEVGGHVLDHFRECPSWTKAAESLAQLQILSIGKQAELLEGQCKDLRLASLTALINPFIERMREFMAEQETKAPAPLTDSELTSLGNRLHEACSRLGELALPDTLGHLDLNPGNIFLAGERCVFLDWAEACVANPIVTFEYVREHFERHGQADATDARSLAAAYLGPWRSLISPDKLDRAMALSPLVAVFAFAATGAWRAAETRRERSHAGYFRSLTRRMQREAVRFEERSKLCCV